ncbi:MAG: IclR family transcriptional regulator [Spirochaetota bacterium]
MQSEGVKKNQSLGKALQIFEVLSWQAAPMRLQDLARELNMPDSTLLRFLNTMIDYGYVAKERETSRYRLTLKLAQLGSQVHSNYPYQKIIHPYLEEISRKLQEPVSLCVEQNGSVVYIDTVDGPDHMLRTLQRIGKVAPMHSTGVGKVLLQNYTSNELKEYVEDKGLPAFTEKTITSGKEFFEEIDVVRQRGFAYDNEECEVGVRCVAFPVKDFSGRNVAAISISAPVTRMDADKEKNIVAVLRDVSTRISQEMGWQPGLRDKEYHG